MSRRPREELEERLVSEWATSTYPKATVTLRARLGRLPPHAADTLIMGYSPLIYTATLHWADALIVYQGKAILAEGKVKLGPNALGQLLAYRELFLETPEYADLQTEPPTLVAVYAYGDPAVEEILRGHGIQVTRYCPQWIQDAYVERLRREYRKQEF